MKRVLTLLGGVLLAISACAADVRTFGVLSQRSPLLTAEFWNPILDYVGTRAGVELRLKISRTAPESNAAIAAGSYDFVYSNTIFQPALSASGYEVILRPRTDAIRGQIVVLEDAPVAAVAELAGREVGFPSRAAFVGYAVPMDHLLRSGIPLTPVFGGNQEGIMGQLKAGKVVAAAVNSEVMKAFARREEVRYRVLWESVPYNDLPIAAHGRLDAGLVAAVRAAFAGMADDPAGQRVLARSAAVIGQKPPYGFLPADRKDYRTYLDFYAHTVVKDVE